MKKRYILYMLMVALSSTLMASESDDLKFINKLYTDKKFDMAVDESNAFLKKYPTSKYASGLIDRVGKVYFLKGNYPKAIKYFSTLLMDKELPDPDKNETNFYLAKSYAEINNFEKSQEALANIDEKSDYKDMGILQTATIYMSLENYYHAKTLYNELLDKKSKYFKDVLLNMAVLEYNQNNYKLAKDYVFSYIEHGGDKDNIFMNYILGVSASKMGDTDLAIESFKKATTGKDRYAQKAHIELLKIYLAQNDISKADEEIRILKNGSEYNSGLEILGGYYINNKNYIKSWDIFTKIPNPSPKICYNLGILAYKLNKYEKSIDYLKTLKDTSYQEESIYYLMADNYELKKYKNVLNLSNQTAKRDKNINIMIANSAYQTKNYDLAKEYFLKYDKNSLGNLYRIIIIDSKLGDLEDLENRFTEYKNLYPQDKKYKNNIYLLLGTVYYKNKNSGRAQELYEEYLKDNSSPQILANLITILLDKKDYTLMIQYLKNAPKNNNTEYLNAVAFMGMGEYKKAGDILDKLLQNKTLNEDLIKKVKVNRIRNYFLNSDYENTIKYGNEYLVNNNFDLAGICNKVAISYFRLNEYSQAIEMYKKLQENTKYSNYATYQIADTYYAEKDYTNAVIWYQKVIESDNKYTEQANYWYLNSLYNLKKYNEFLAQKNIFLQKYPTSDMIENIYTLTSYIYESNGDTKELVENYKKLYGITKNESKKQDIISKIMDIYLKEKNIQEATALLEKIKNSNDKDYYNTQILVKSDKIKEALPIYEKLLQSKKYNTYANLKLAEYYMKQKEYKKAKKYYSNLDAMGNNPYKDLVVYELGVIAQEQKDYNLAYRNFTKCYTMYDGKYKLLSKYRAAQVAQKLKKDDEAQELYTELYNEEDFKYWNNVLENLLAISIEKKEENATDYYDELMKVEPELAKKYEKYFKGGK